MSVQRNLLISQQNQAIYKALKRSMVLWYDVKRQGATNESMSANPKLLDLSGNGYDADCHNFAWSGISGIGESLFSSLTSWFKSLNNDGEYTVSDTKLHITKATNRPSLYYYISNNKVINNNAFIDSYTENSVTIKPFKVKVSGLPENYNVVIDGIYTVGLGTGNYKVPKIMVGNGEHVCDFGTIETAITIGPKYQFHFPRIFTDMPAGTICDVTVELLPGYPDALVSDGIDDWCSVSGLPLMDDYTVIAKRERFDYISRGATATKLINDGARTGAFALEVVFYASNTLYKQAFSFGSANTLDNFAEASIVYQTKKLYNKTPIAVSSLPDTDTLNIFSIRPKDGFTAGAMWSFILFDRTLTEEEINWVKNNLIEGDFTP